MDLRLKSQESTIRSSLPIRSLAPHAAILVRSSALRRAPRRVHVNAAVLTASTNNSKVRYGNESRKRLKTRQSTRNSCPSSPREIVANFSSGLSPRNLASAKKKAEASTMRKPKKSGNTSLISNYPSSSQSEDKLPAKNPLANTRMSENQVKGSKLLLVKGSKLLLTINVLGSAGPLRFFVDVKDPVKHVIELSLKTYAHEGRLPVLGSDSTSVDLYCVDSNFEPLDPKVSIGSLGTRQFILHQKIHDRGVVLPTAAKHGHFSIIAWKFWSHLSCSSGDVTN